MDRKQSIRCSSDVIGIRIHELVLTSFNNTSWTVRLRASSVVCSSLFDISIRVILVILAERIR